MADKPSIDIKAALVARNRAERASVVAQEGQDPSQVASVRADMELPGNANLAGAARAAKLRQLAETIFGGAGPAAEGLARAVEAIEEAEARQADLQDAEAAWTGYHQERRDERRAAEVLKVAEKLNQALGQVTSRNDGRATVILRIDATGAWTDQEKATAIAHIYGQPVADAYDSSGVSAAVAALPEVW